MLGGPERRRAIKGKPRDSSGLAWPFRWLGVSIAETLFADRCLFQDDNNQKGQGGVDRGIV